MGARRLHKKFYIKIQNGLLNIFEGMVNDKLKGILIHI